MNDLERIARAIWGVRHPDAWWDGPAGPSATERRLAFNQAIAAVNSLMMPSVGMMESAAVALRNYIHTLPPEVRAKSKERGGFVFVGPKEKHTIRFQAMLCYVLDQTDTPAGGEGRSGK
jgi:hypothetical protein